MPEASIREIADTLLSEDKVRITGKNLSGTCPQKSSRQAADSVALNRHYRYFQ